MVPNRVPVSRTIWYWPASACCHCTVSPATMVTTAGRKQVDQAPTGTTRGALVGRKPAGVGAASGVGAAPRGWATGH